MTRFELLAVLAVAVAGVLAFREYLRFRVVDDAAQLAAARAMAHDQADAAKWGIVGGTVSSVAGSVAGIFSPRKWFGF